MKQEHGRWNIVVVVADTLRTAFMGAYGNDWVHTPHMDRMAREGIRFSRAHPESLPTIPTRRTLHTGRRAFPFGSYAPLPWDNVYLPGWEPMSSDEGTLAEALVKAGYHTGFYADVPHYFVPGMNFTRGFRQWQFIRGQAEDRLHATDRIDARLLQRYRGNPDRVRAHLANVRPQMPEETWPAARTFRAAIDFVEANSANNPFYLFVDTFSPHETWEAPRHYYDLYGSDAEREPICLTVPYGPLARHPEYEERLPSIRANYAGLVTLVDTWFGKLLDAIDRTGQRERTLVMLLSDHGTNFGENPDRVIGKPADFMYPGTMDIPLIVRRPDGTGAGTVRDELTYSLDVPATVVQVSGAEPVGGTEGRSLLDTADGQGAATPREYLTCRYGNSVWYRDHRTWFFSACDFSAPHVFDLECDPACQQDISATAANRISLARERLTADAGGPLQTYRFEQETDALGRPVLAANE
jgi:arylsulfatase A-like enzyme